MWERIRASITENLNLKLLSFAFALVIYSLVHGGQDARRSIVVDLEAIPPSENSDRILVTSIPHSVRLFARGSNQTIDNLRASSVSVVIDLSQSAPTHVTFDPKMVRLPEGVNVEIEQFDLKGKKVAHTKVTKLAKHNGVILPEETETEYDTPVGPAIRRSHHTNIRVETE